MHRWFTSWPAPSALPKSWECAFAAPQTNSCSRTADVCTLGSAILPAPALALPWQERNRSPKVLHLFQCLWTVRQHNLGFSEALFTPCTFYININNIPWFRFMKTHTFPAKDVYTFSGCCLKCPVSTNQEEQLKGTHYVSLTTCHQFVINATETPFCSLLMSTGLWLSHKSVLP